MTKLGEGSILEMAGLNVGDTIMCSCTSPPPRPTPRPTPSCGAPRPAPVTPRRASHCTHRDRLQPPSYNCLTRSFPRPSTFHASPSPAHSMIGKKMVTDHASTIKAIDATLTLTP